MHPTVPTRFAHALLGLLLLAISASAQAPPIRIMPLGDSITDGSAFDSPDGSGGYRGKLFSLLTAAGYNVDSIGSLTINSGLLPAAEKEHEGHSGWRIDQLDAGMAGWLASMADPDVVLMHIGTNDFGQSTNTATAIDRLDALILKIAQLRPYAHIIVTNLMERGEPQNTNIQTQFNPFVQSRVNAHAAAGRRVTFLDMRAAVPLSDMPDNLHPSQAGYDKMAAAWLPAIQAVIGPEGDAAAPAITRTLGGTNRTSVAVTFSKPVADTAAAVGNFALSGGLTVTGAALDASKRVVTLTTSEQALGTSYTVTVNGVQDRIATPNTIAANSTATFSAAIPRGYSNHVPESAGYTLAYSLDVPAVANYLNLPPAYAVDNRNGIGPFTRVAYYVELQTEAGDLQYLWASMDPFTNDANQIAVPTMATGAIFQQSVANLNVVSNVASVTTGTGLTGNIEFWPTNYSSQNGAGVPGASESLYDFGDTRTPTGTYGSMQLHNTGAAQTLFAFNNWGGSGTTTNAELGIGNNPSGNPDWTFTPNAGSYTVKTIQVLVQTTGDFTAPTPVSALASFGRTSVTVRFSEPIAAGSVKAANFSLTGGATVLGASVAPNQREVILTTTTQPAGSPLTLTINGVRDSSPNANLVTAGTTVGIAEATLPPEIVANAGAAASGYHVVQSINLPVAGNFNAGNSASFLDERTFGTPFTRVAYYLELQKPGAAAQFVWVSMDAFTANRNRLGLPTTGTGAVFQRNVSNMEVISNVAGVTNGSGITGGNLEFWPSNYAAAKAAASPPNASDTALDFGDSGAATTAGHGSMQVHNGAAGHTIFAINNFGVDNQALAMGIGNQPTGNLDWTFAANGATYSRRVLHVLVLPGATAPGAVTSKVPEAANYQLVASVNIPATGNLNNATIYGTSDVRSDVGAFSRVAYYFEIKKPTDAVSSYVWTSMDAFTTDITKIGVPTTASASLWQQNVTNMNVVSNVAGIVNGTGIATGNLEFWAGNYTQARAAVSPANASSTTYDFGDSGATTAAGHGSMQVHNHGASQTLFSLTNWGSTSSTTNKFGMGIGNNPAPLNTGVDWTFAANSDLYDTRILHIFVQPGASDSTAPAITRLTPSTELNRIVVTFSEPVADTAAALANFAIDGGVTTTSARLLPGNRDIALTTSAQTPGTTYTLSVSSVRDRSPSGNLIAPGASATFTGYTPPAILSNVPEASGYKLIHQLAIPSVAPRWNLNPISYAIDESKYGEQGFDRVAYLMELNSDWVYASFDPFTTSITKIGVPTLGVTSTAFQQKVTRLNVASNMAGIVTGTELTGGNIEFWGGNYSAPNALSIPNASATTFDFGDTMTAGSHGSMQVHNHEASQTLFAYNNWGSNAGTSDTGIGNNPNAGSAGVGGTQAPDWTFTANAPSFATRNLYVLARPAPLVPTGPAPQLLSQPTSRSVNQGGNTTLAVAVNGAGPFTYQWRRNGMAVTGATDSWLDLASFGAAQAGNYDVVVTSASGASTTSQAAAVSLANSLPIFSGYAFTVGRNEVASISFAQLLAKASDPDGNPLSITAASGASTQGGTVALQSGSVLYTPAADFLGADAFTITVTDSLGGSVTGTVNAAVTSAALNPAGGSTVARRADGKIDLLFRGTPGQSTLVERTIDFTAWTVLQTVTPGDDGFIPFTDANPPTEQAFYRSRPANP